MSKGQVSKNIIHRRVLLEPSGGAGVATARAQVGTGFAPGGSNFVLASSGGNGVGGVLRFVAVDYTAAPATTDLTISDSFGGEALLTLTNTNTDLSLRAITMTAGVDEGGAAIAATDGTAGGMPFVGGLDISVAQADNAPTCTIVVDLFFELCHFVRTILRPVGADGSAADSRIVRLPGRQAGIIRALRVDYQNQPATADLTITRDVVDPAGTGGTAIFTTTNTATDIPISPCGTTAGNETAAATAATDATDGGFPFMSNVQVAVAQGDGQAQGDELIIVDLWIDG